MGQINNILGNTLLESGSFPPCRVATTAAITLSGLQTIDGELLVAGDRVLVKDQADARINGIYAAATGNWVRTTDAARNTQYFQGMTVFIALGAVSQQALFMCSCADNPVVIGASAITFERVGPGDVSGNGSSVAGNIPSFSDSSGRAIEDSGIPAAALRRRLTAHLDLYVNAAIGDDTHDGLTPNTAFKTPGRASSYIQNSLDVGGQTIDVWCQEGVGTYESLNVVGPYPGANGGVVTFHGSLQRTITNASNTSPIVITAPGHGFTNGAHVVTHGITGNRAALGAYLVGSATLDTFVLLNEIDGSNSVGNGTYAGGGIVSSPRNCPIAGVGQPGISGSKLANFNVDGFSTSSDTSQGLISNYGSMVATAGPMDFGACGADHVTGYRRGYVEILYNFSISGDAGGSFMSGSHGGEVRKEATGYFTASVNFGLNVFATVDWGDVVETSGTELLVLTGLSNATPIVAMTSVPHHYRNGELVQVEAATGNKAANGAWAVANATATTFELVDPATGANSTGNGVYPGAAICIGPGNSWHRQGFAVPRSGVLRGYSITEAGNIQTHGISPPFQNWYPSNIAGVAFSGNVNTPDSYYQIILGNSFSIIAGPDELSGGFIVRDPNNIVDLLSIRPSGKATFSKEIAIGAQPTDVGLVRIGASTADKAQIFMDGGVAPTSPTDGQIWFDGTNLKMCINGTTKTFTLT